MNKSILSIAVVGLICGIVGFQAGRSGMMPKTDADKYRQKIQEGIRDYKRYYFATRTKMSELFEEINDRKQWFYRDMPDSFKTGSQTPQCVIDLFGNLDTWKANYLKRTINLDSQVRDIEVRIASATTY